MDDNHTTWLIIAQIGDIIAEDDDVMTIDIIVMDERDTLIEAEAECRHRNARADGRHYFPMAEPQYDQMVQRRVSDGQREGGRHDHN